MYSCDRPPWTKRLHDDFCIVIGMDHLGRTVQCFQFFEHLTAAHADIGGLFGVPGCSRKPLGFPRGITAKDFRCRRRPESNGDLGAAIKRV
jgi:hypothetical protein